MSYLCLAAITVATLFLTPPAAKPVHHYVFFGQDRESLTKDSLFLNTPAIEGAQIADVREQILSIEGRAAQKYWGIVRAVLPASILWPGRETRGASETPR